MPCEYEFTGSETIFINETSLSSEETKSDQQTTPESQYTDISDNDPFKFSSLRIDDPSSFEVPESRARRLFEIRLFHNYMDKIIQPFPEAQSPELLRIWEDDVPKMALDHENMLYAILAVSVTHLHRQNPEDLELRAARDRYTGLAMREQRNAVARLDKDNADPVCFASALILVNGFANLQDRDIAPYTPPTEWFYLGKGTRAVHRMARFALKGHRAAKILVIVKAPPPMDDQSMMLIPENRQIFEYLLDPTIQMETEIWNQETLEAYEIPVTFIGAIRRAIRDNEPLYAICRRIQAFTMVCPDRYIQFVTEQRPRALIILAHFFAVVAMLGCDGCWWLGSVGLREVQGIQTVINPQWQYLMQWPMSIVNVGSTQ